MKKFFLLLLCYAFCLIGCKQPATSKGQPAKNFMAKSLDLYLPDDLEATLWAESPLFYNPTNMDVDIKGRIWITEAVNYRNFNNDSAKFRHHTGGDRVMILEDRDGDGKADTAFVFVQGKDLDGRAQQRCVQKFKS